MPGPGSWYIHVPGRERFRSRQQGRRRRRFRYAFLSSFLPAVGVQYWMALLLLSLTRCVWEGCLALACCSGMRVGVAKAVCVHKDEESHCCILAASVALTLCSDFLFYLSPAATSICDRNTKGPGVRRTRGRAKSRRGIWLERTSLALSSAPRVDIGPRQRVSLEETLRAT
jgi:hypothetical protein